MLREISAKSVLHYHATKFATHWDANIYRGCEHSCVYCFAQYSHKYLDADFFGDIFVKANAPEVLAKEFRRRTWQKDIVNIAGVSDAYQTVEAERKIMPEVLKNFIAARNPLAMATKSTLPLRDIELFAKLAKCSDVYIAVSVSTLNEDFRKKIEPNAAPTLERLAMLREFKKIGCHTGILFMPIIPYISDDAQNMDEIFRIGKDLGVDSMNTWQLHLRGNVKKQFFTFITEHFPDLLTRFQELYRGGSEVSSAYKEDLNRKLQDLRDKYALHTSYKPQAKQCMKQLSLFD